MSKQDLLDLIDLNLPDNTGAYITPARLREVITAVVETEFENYKVPATITVEGSESINLMAGMVLEALVAIPDSSNLIRVGTTAGGSEIAEVDLVSGTNFIRIDYYVTALTEIHFTGDCQLTIFKR